MSGSGDSFCYANEHSLPLRCTAPSLTHSQEKTNCHRLTSASLRMHIRIKFWLNRPFSITTTVPHLSWLVLNVIIDLQPCVACVQGRESSMRVAFSPRFLFFPLSSIVAVAATGGNTWRVRTILVMTPKLWEHGQRKKKKKEKMLKGMICTGIASLVLVIPAYVSSSALIRTKKDRETVLANPCNYSTCTWQGQ